MFSPHGRDWLTTYTMHSTSHQSPPASFTPRKEFLNKSSHSISSFALLTFSSSSSIRLYSFPPAVLLSLHRYLDNRRYTAAYREDSTNNYCEFTLHGKPWSNSKSIATERLLINVLAIILQSGYNLLSSLDYGREQDDRVALAFSKPSAQLKSGSSNSHSPVPTITNTVPSNHDSSSQPSITVPFAVSFASATTLRVISPPLNSTPAILGAVRGAWPRGVVSERKIGDSCYEFKLNGYRWFQENTFATDSLRHILSLLESLDSHSFTLLTSLSLASHSRVKDLWVFTGLSDEPHRDICLSTDADPELPDSPPVTPTPGPSELASLKPPLSTQPVSPTGSSHGGHRKMGSAPQPYQPDPSGAHDTRTPMNGLHRRASSPSRPPALRKPAPRAQVPVSITDAPSQPRTDQVHRIALPSTVGSSLDMTGVGIGPSSGQKPDIQFPGYPVTQAPRKDSLAGGRQPEIVAPIPVLAGRRGSSPQQPPFKLKRRTPPPDIQYLDAPLCVDSPAPSPKHSTPPLDQPRTPSPPPASPTPPLVEHPGYNTNETPTSSTLLGPSAFRSVGGEGRVTTVLEGFRDSAFTTGSDLKSYEIPIKWTGSRPEPKTAESSGPFLSGAWSPTPVEEYDEDHVVGTYRGRKTPDKQETDGRIKSPKLVEQQDGTRKSEAGVVGVMPEKERSNKLQKASEGWVIVNVERRALPTPTDLKQESDSRTEHRRETSSDPVTRNHLGSPVEGGPVNRPRSPPPPHPNGTVSPAAKVIAIIDAVESKEKPSSSSPQPGIKRLLSFSRKEKDEKSKGGVGLRQRWKRLGATSKSEG